MQGTLLSDVLDTDVMVDGGPTPMITHSPTLDPVVKSWLDRGTFGLRSPDSVLEVVHGSQLLYTTKDTILKIESPQNHFSPLVSVHCKRRKRPFHSLLTTGKERLQGMSFTYESDSSVPLRNRREPLPQ